MVSLGILVAFVQRLALVLLFLPASALDKIINFRGAEKQAAEISPTLAPLLIAIGLFVEIFMSLGILTGVADRLAGFIMGGYCGVTALLWKQFWKPGDFWAGGKGRDLFWDFLKNFALGAGFMFITFGTGPAAIASFVTHPFASTHPYSAHASVPEAASNG